MVHIFLWEGCSERLISAYKISDAMPIYVMLTTLTDKGRMTIKVKPERIKEVNKEVEAMGAKILAQYAVLGPYDFINILDAPDDKTVTRVAVELGSRGTLQTLTMPTITIDDLIDAIKK
ncbi:MAG: GYD domain-containing protein [Candidatus Methylarchaceae archaeon HK01B]|nr:GYD domain-containing protein [Candidatus Methylarchaceae archaeon HK01B]